MSPEAEPRAGPRANPSPLSQKQWRTKWSPATPPQFDWPVSFTPLTQTPHGPTTTYQFQRPPGPPYNGRTTWRQKKPLS
ncbi:unnamed protein product [Nezara viridula]|uniref:Uncharacterized protein n=1 Tax=Nezara viridula TaxID=85310 RepID=A0A9P0GW14_NEZVI|nr:unnamed protein product [Nezara viridula]